LGPGVETRFEGEWDIIIGSSFHHHQGGGNSPFEDE